MTVIEKPPCAQVPCALCDSRHNEPLHRPLSHDPHGMSKRVRLLWDDGVIPGKDRGEGRVALRTLTLRAGYASHGWTSWESPFPLNSWRFEREAVAAMLDLHRHWYSGALPGCPGDDVELWRRFRATYAELRARADRIDAVALGREQRHEDWMFGVDAELPHWLVWEVARSDKALFDVWVSGEIPGFSDDDQALLEAQARAELELRCGPVPDPAPPPPPPTTSEQLWREMDPRTRAALRRAFGTRPPAPDLEREAIWARLHDLFGRGEIPRTPGDEEDWDAELALAEHWANRDNESEGATRIEVWADGEAERLEYLLSRETAAALVRLSRRKVDPVTPESRDPAQDRRARAYRDAKLVSVYRALFGAWTAGALGPAPGSWPANSLLRAYCAATRGGLRRDPRGRPPSADPAVRSIQTRRNVVLERLANELQA